MRANVEFEPFNSIHEAYAVLKEEIEEAQEEDEIVNDTLDTVWYEVKCNGEKEKLISLCKTIKEHAILNAAESIQVAAMSQKFINMLELQYE